ncbi:MAG TPA: ROK family transcriptional regulator [Pyrinomonadaceae bacterium]|nr:ROK family transcriptional regulator [Pyrinomonadaceae bacterium]
MKRINLKKASVARADTIRTINRQIVLNYVRERSPISRAEIAHETALQRSTISLIVEELKAEGLVEEIDGESTGGRPPLLLRLRASGPVAVGVDVGTKRTVVATSDLAGRVLEQVEFETDPDAEETLERMIRHVTRLVKKDRETVEGVGVSLPGLVDFETGTALFIPRFKWRDWAVGRAVGEATGLPVAVDNDANAVALAELWFGRPEVREVRDFIMVLVESGLGTGVVFDGQVYRGEMGAAGEFGHMTIGQGAPVACATGSRECWEAFASERAALARYRAAGDGHAPPRFGFDQLIDRALGGEEAARAALTETARYLGLGVANLIKGLSPEAVILGGRIARAWALIEEELRRAVASNSLCRGLPAPRIFVSSLGERPRLRGALSLVLAGKFASPLTT